MPDRQDSERPKPLFLTALTDCVRRVFHASIDRCPFPNDRSVLRLRSQTTDKFGEGCRKTLDNGQVQPAFRIEKIDSAAIHPRNIQGRGQA